MAVRYYVCPVIGSGTEDDPYRASISEDRISHGASIPTGKDGRPIDDWCVVTIDEVDRDKAMQVSGVEEVSDFDAGKVAIEAKRGVLR